TAMSHPMTLSGSMFVPGRRRLETEVRMFDRLAHVAARRRVVVLAVSLALPVVAPLAGTTLFHRPKTGGFDDPGAESGTAAAILEERFAQAEPNLVLLAEAPEGVDAPESVRAGTALTQRLAESPGVEGVQSYWTAGRAPQLRGSDGDR